MAKISNYLLDPYKALEAELDNDESYAEKNVKRLTQVQTELARPSFPGRVRIVTKLMQGLDMSLNKMLHRAEQLNALKRSLPSSTEYEVLASSCRSSFMNIVSGSLGQDAVAVYVEGLRFGFQQIAAQTDHVVEHAKTFFQQSLFAMADCWRRLCYNFMPAPFIFFGLLECDFQQFLTQWRHLHDVLKMCGRCYDPGFSIVLLRLVGELDGLSEAQQWKAFAFVIDLLLHIATFCPLASEASELKHAQLQSMAHRFRGSRKTGDSLGEMSLIDSFVCDHAALEEKIYSLTMPSKTTVGKMVAKVGVSDPSYKGRLGAASKEQRVMEGKSRKLRSISGWNVFVQHKTEDSAGMSQEEYKVRMKALSQEWAALLPEDREAYGVEAGYQNDCRAELMTKPLTASNCQVLGEQPDDPMQKSTKQLEEIVGDKALKKMSFRRLVANEAARDSHHAWDLYGLGLGDANGALKADLIDMFSTDSAVKKQLDESVNMRPQRLPDLPPDHGSVHREVCHLCFGQCEQSPFVHVAHGFVKQLGQCLLKNKVSSGSLLKFKPVQSQLEPEYFFWAS
jgi:hypothetical protein